MMVVLQWRREVERIRSLRRCRRRLRRHHLLLARTQITLRTKLL